MQFLIQSNGLAQKVSFKKGYCMEKIKLYSSLERNKPKTFFLFKRKSFVNGMFGFLFGIFFGNIFSNIAAIFSFIFPISFAIIFFMFTEYAYNGKYTNQRIELFCSKINEHMLLIQVRQQQKHFLHDCLFEYDLHNF